MRHFFTSECSKKAAVKAAVKQPVQQVTNFRPTMNSRTRVRVVEGTVRTFLFYRHRKSYALTKAVIMITLLL